MTSIASAACIGIIFRNVPDGPGSCFENRPGTSEAAYLEVRKHFRNEVRIPRGG